GSTDQGPPLTLILTLPPSQPISVATQWSKATRGTLAPSGTVMTGLSRNTAPDSSSSAQLPMIRSGTKAANMPLAPLGRSSTTSQLGVSKVAGLATSCEPTVHPAGSEPLSQSSKKKGVASP